MRIINLLTILLLATSLMFAQQPKNNSINELKIQPQPKSVVDLNRSVIIDKSILTIVALANEEKKAADYFNFLIGRYFSSLSVKMGNNKSTGWKIRFEKIPLEHKHPNDQYYLIKCNNNKKEILISSPGQLGLLFGAVTLKEFIKNENGIFQIHLYNVEDWPDYSRREISANFKGADVEELLNYALLNKMETLAIASRTFPWHRADNEYMDILTKIKSWKDKFGGPRIMIMQNIYDRKQIEISNSNDVDSLKNVVLVGLKHGVDKIMILADDTPPFKYGEGYILTSENDKKQFKHMADAHCYLMNDLKNWLSKNSFNPELYYVPPFYTYEDMNYGDLELYKNTPWEKDAYEPLIQDLKFAGQNMPEDLFIIWCGPNVRSRKITIDDLNDWTFNLAGRTPYLWDNTIYSHHPFTSTPLFSAYDNDLPTDFYNRTDGNGMFVNGDANAEDSKAAMITVADYLWNSKNYNPQRSISMAMERLYGYEPAKLLMQFKETELELRKKIGERKLWFEADTLWSIIRKIRYIHDKNPFYYHLNYTRMKALRLQLKNSVPTVTSKEDFILICNALDRKRNEILDKVKSVNNEIYNRVRTIMLPLPDFNKIQ